MDTMINKLRLGKDDWKKMLGIDTTTTWYETRWEEVYVWDLQKI